MQKAAFTLVELMVVVVILAIIAATAVPMFSGSHDAQVQAIARALVADLELAQSTALARQASVALVFSADLQHYKVALASQDLGSYDAVVPLDHPLKAGHPYEVTPSADLGAPDAAVVTVNFGGDRAIVFDSFASPDFAGTLVVRGGNATLVLSVEAVTGRVSVSQGG
jgi:prepilin-type N-terminal cleavage/methylation domain-containing protein